MKKLKLAIEELLSKTGIEKPVQQNKIFIIWEDIVGEMIAKNTEREEVKHGVLIVRTATSVWRNELAMMKKEIMKEIDRQLGEGIIKDIRLL